MTTVTPQAIDEYVSIEWVQVVGRHRKELGDVAALARSIELVGLLNPITLTRDGRLVAGQRRLEACRSLGWQAVPARFVDNLGDAVLLLTAERDENTQRKDMLPSELVSLGRSLEALERPKAEERKAAGQRLGAARTNQDQSASSSPEVQALTKASTDEAVAAALGIGESTYYRAKALVRAAEAGDERAAEAVREMDETGKVTPAYDRYKGRPSAPSGHRRHSRVDERPALPPIPDPDDRTTAGNLERREAVRQLAGMGYTSAQIGEMVGRGEPAVKDILREAGIVNRADEVMARKQGKKIDSNRIVRKTVESVAYIDTGLDMVVWDDLDRDEIPDWVETISAAVRTLNALKKQLKELVP